MPPCYQGDHIKTLSVGGQDTPANMRLQGQTCTASGTSNMIHGIGKMKIDMVKTRKLLVAYDPLKPSDGSGDFLVPINDSGGILFFGLRSRRQCGQGRVVYIGKEITMNDVFAKLVDSGREIENVLQTTKGIEEYLRMLQDYKIGNIIGIETSRDETSGFRLTKVANMGAVEKKRLP